MTNTNHLPGLFDGSAHDGLQLAQAAGAWDQADLLLRFHLRRWLQDGCGDADQLTDVLTDALGWAQDQDQPTWEHRWSALADLARDARRSPSLVRGLLGLPEGRRAGVLRYLVSRAQPCPRKDLESALFHDSSSSYLTQVLAWLDAEGLIFRPKIGREVVVSLSKRGRDLLRSVDEVGARTIVVSARCWHLTNEPTPFERPQPTAASR